MVNPFTVFTVAALVIVWAVLTGIWMHVLDDHGEPWWAVYVPVYSLVCALRAVGASSFHAIWIVLLTFLGFWQTGRTPTDVAPEVRAGMLAVPTLMILVGPILLHSWLIEIKRG